MLVAELHQSVSVHILSWVGGEKVVEVGEEIFGTYVDSQFVADVVLFVKFESEAVVCCVDNHNAVNAIASRHIGDVEGLAFSPLVAHEGTKGLDDVVRVAAELLGYIICLGLCEGCRAEDKCEKEWDKLFHYSIKLKTCDSIYLLNLSITVPMVCRMAL